MSVDPLIRQLLVNGIVQVCPFCTILTEKTDGCNYIECTICKCQWCWCCHKIKTFSPIKDIDGQNSLCDDKTHNSH